LINLGSIFDAGLRAINAGDLDVYREAVRLSSKVIRDLAIAGDVDAALTFQASWYQTLVKQVESEENYHYAFRWHHAELQAAGKLRRSGRAYRSARRNIAFIVPNGVLLGHTQVLLGMIREWRESGIEINPHVFSLSGFSVELSEPLQKLSVGLASPLNGRSISPSASIDWCGAAVKHFKCGIAVWVSVPTWSSFALGSGLATEQVFWSLKFHPIHHGPDVKHIAMTPPGDGCVSMSGGPWLRFSPPLSVRGKPREPVEIAALRRSFYSQFVFGSLARSEKFNSQHFVRAVGQIISSCPGSVFVYTGHSDSPMIREEFLKRGLSDRLRYVGWVDTELYSQAIDVFLETFPFGCGVTGAQAVNAGTRMVSLWCPETLPSYYFPNIERARRVPSHWVVATSAAGYVDAAIAFYKETTVPPAESRLKDFLATIDKSKSNEFLRLVLEGDPK
jgi:hypothetical protein